MTEISWVELFVIICVICYTMVMPPIVWMHGYKTGMKHMGYAGFESQKPAPATPENVMETDPWNQAVYGPTEEEKKLRLPTVKGEVS